MFGWEKIRQIYHKLMHSPVSQREVAEGFALGSFVAMLPIPGQGVVAIGLAALLKTNKLAALIACFITNPLTSIPIFYFNYKLGRFFLRDKEALDFRAENLQDLFNISGDIIVPLWLGCIICGVFSAFIGYYAAKWSYPALRVKQEKFKEKMRKRAHGHTS